MKRGTVHCVAWGLCLIAMLSCGSPAVVERTSLAAANPRRAGARGPDWLSSAKDPLDMDAPQLAACATEEQFESDGVHGLVTYRLRVVDESASGLSERLFARARERSVELERFATYAQTDPRPEGAGVSVKANELEITEAMSLAGFQSHITPTLRGSSLASLVDVVGGPASIRGFSVARDGRGRCSMTLDARALPQPSEAVIEIAPPTEEERRTDAARARALEALAKWRALHGLQSLGYDAATGSDSWAATQGGERIKLSLAADGLSATSTESGFDTSGCASP